MDAQVHDSRLFAFIRGFFFGSGFFGLGYSKRSEYRVLQLNFSKSYPQTEIQIDCEFTSGFVALFGPSGAGKTTTLHCVAGLLSPDAGQIKMHGRVLFSGQDRINLPARKRNIGLIFQEGRLFPHLSVRDNLCFGRNVARALTFDEAVDLLQLSPLLHRRPASCSGGEKQRIALGRALLAAPAYLLMDEPLAAVEVPERHRILKSLRGLQDSHQLPVLYVTHDPGMVLNHAERMLFIKQGQIASAGEPFAVLQQEMSAAPGQPLANLISGRILEKGHGYTRVEMGALQLQTPALPAANGEVVYLNIPAEEVVLATEEPHGLSARNVFRGRVRGWHEQEGLVFVQVALPGWEQLTAEILPHTVEKLALAVDQELYVIIKATGVRQV